MGRILDWAERRRAKRRDALGAMADRAIRESPPPPPVPPTAPGWYADPAMADTQRYWDGAVWTEHVAPMTGQPASASTSSSNSQVYMLLVLTGTAIGTIMAMQSASLLTGTGSNWTGVAIVVAAAILARFVRNSIPAWVRIVAILAALASLANVIYLENELDNKREEISNMFP